MKHPCDITHIWKVDECPYCKIQEQQQEIERLEEDLFRSVPVDEYTKKVEQLEKEVDDQNEAAYNLLIRNKAFKRQVEEQNQEIERLKSEYVKLQARIDYLMNLPCKCEVENL